VPCCFTRSTDVAVKHPGQSSTGFDEDTSIVAVWQLPVASDQLGVRNPLFLGPRTSPWGECTGRARISPSTTIKVIPWTDISRSPNRKLITPIAPIRREFKLVEERRYRRFKRLNPMNITPE
jgi:hypothetical protein